MPPLAAPPAPTLGRWSNCSTSIRILKMGHLSRPSRMARLARTRIPFGDVRWRVRRFAGQGYTLGRQPTGKRRIAFAQAFRLSALYPDTVGADGEIIATLPAPTFLHACVRRGTDATRRRTPPFSAGLCEQDRTWTTKTVAAIEAEAQAQAGAAKLALRHRQLVSGYCGPSCGRTRRNRQTLPMRIGFSATLFPRSTRSLPGEVEVARHGKLHLLLHPFQRRLRQNRNLPRPRRDGAPAPRSTTSSGCVNLTSTTFSHFPAFTSFEAREMDPAHLERLAAAIWGLSAAELIALLNTVIFIEERDNLEKYLVHDSWGHYWQADLTQPRYALRPHGVAPVAAFAERYVRTRRR